MDHVMQRKVIMSFALLSTSNPLPLTQHFLAISTICCSDCASSTAWRVIRWQTSPLVWIVSVNKHVFFINPFTLNPLFSVSVFLLSFPVTLNPLKVEGFEGSCQRVACWLISWWLTLEVQYMNYNSCSRWVGGSSSSGCMMASTWHLKGRGS